MSRRIGNRGLRRLCRSCGARLTDLANLLGCCRTSIFRYLNGRRSPHLERRMAEVFGISTEHLRRTLGIDQGEHGHA